jgi:rSAM/selenodomain-associated transferase 1
VIFAKAPRLGRVKRRLAREIGDVEAWQFFRSNLFAIARTLGNDLRWKTWLAVAPDRLARDAGGWPAGLSRLLQGSGDLGARMARTLRGLVPGSVVIVGSDVPEIAASHIAAAFDALGDHDAVFGPTPDGGYWLIGWANRRPMPLSALRNVRWSTTAALAQSVASLGSGVSVALVDTLEDIDDAAGYSRWRRRSARRRSVIGR